MDRFLISCGKRIALALLILLTVAGNCPAQKKLTGFDDVFSGKIGVNGPSKPQFTTTVTPESAATGETVTLAIAVRLPKGYYIYSTDGEFDGKTKIDVELAGLEPVDQEFSPDREPKVAFESLFKVDVGKFFDTVTWTRKYRITAEDGVATLAGKLTGQYCSGPDAEVQQCVPIAPPYKFNAEVPIQAAGSQTSATDLADTAAPGELIYSRHIQPMNKAKSGEKPAPIAWDFSLSPTDARPGDTVTFSIRATLQDGWHTFSLSQAGDGGLPTELDVAQLHGLKPLGDGFTAEPPFEIEEYAGLTLEVHNHSVTWSRGYEVLPDVAPGQYGVGGTVAYQTCRQGQCNPLKKTKFALGTVPEGPLPAAAGNPPMAVDPPMAQNERTAAPAEDVVAAVKPPTALLPFLLLCFGGGLVALLTPCSFPMVPITVSFFLKQSESQHKRPWLLALVYCGSIVAAFTILGVGISFLFGATKLNELANISWLNVIIGAVFVLFSLNMLGVFDIHMPGWLVTMTASNESAGSYLGAVFMALTFTLTSFTCTFAIAGSLLVGAAQGDVYWPVIGMLAFGTAFASPFFVLAMLPGLLKKLPKSGGWMNSVKVVMGLLELGAAVKFFSIADPGQVLFDHVLVMLIWFVLAVVTAVYLFGWFHLPHDTQTHQISPWRMLLGTSFFVLAGLLLTGVALPDRGGMVVRQILAFAPAKFEAGQGALGPSLVHHGLEFALYFDKAVPVAQKQNRPLLLDFTGVNCANCRDMELRMGQAAWKQRIAKFIGVQLYVDTPKIPTIVDPVEGERLQQENIQQLLKWFDDVSMPLYAVVTPDGKEVLSTFAGAEGVANDGTFVKFLDEGWAKWEQRQAQHAGRVPATIQLAGER